MKPCNDCPFLKSSPLQGAPDWLEDVMKHHHADPYFTHSCHKTDPRADGFVGGKKSRECAGHLMMIINDNDGTPGKGGVYRSIEELIERYLVKWLGRKKFEKMKLKSLHRNLSKERES